MSTQITQMSASELADRIARGDLSPVDVVDVYLDRIDRRDDAFNAYVTVLHERARNAARAAERAIENGEDVGPLHGVPVAIKDLTAVADERLTFGCAPLAENVAEQNAPVVDRLEAAGAIVLGKTTTPEFGLKVITDSELTGVTPTPFDTGKHAGGSSGGSAAAVAARLAPIAEGSDAGGSVRIPSAFCGVYGLKPSFGRIPLSSRPDAFRVHTPFVHHGTHSRTVADTALMLDVTVGAHSQDPFSIPSEGRSYRDAVGRGIDGLDVAYSPDLGVYPVDPQVRAVVDDAAFVFEEAGASVEAVEVELGHTLDELVGESSMVQWEVHTAVLADNLQEQFGIDIFDDHREEVPETMVEMAEAGREHSGIEYKQADQIRTDVYDGIQRVFEEYDLLVTPTVIVPPFDVDTVGPTEVDGVAVDPLSGWFMTSPFNMTGHPAASIPGGFTDDGLPIGMQIVGRRFADDDVLAASAAFEELRPWQDRYPHE